MSGHPNTELAMLGSHRLRVRMANSFFSRFKGLMFAAPLPEDEALLITRCPSVHSAFMRCPIDVVYLDESGHVLRTAESLQPWRASLGGEGARHVLELRAGSIKRLGIRRDDTFTHAFFKKPSAIRVPHQQRGATMVEFLWLGWWMSVIGLGLLQYGTLFFAKNQMNQASFMAARAGSVGNANLNTVLNAYKKALLPLYGGGRNESEWKEAIEKMSTDLPGNLKVELLNPTPASFKDWNDPALQSAIGKGNRVIPFANQSSKDAAKVGASSHQTIQDANLIKLRITQGYEPKIAIAGKIYTAALKLGDKGDDAFYTRMVNAGRVPVVTDVTLQMQTDAIEQANNVLMPEGPGSGGSTTPTVVTGPPDCLVSDCSTTTTPVDPSTGNGGGSTSTGGTTYPSCQPAASTMSQSLPSDTLFSYGQSTLTAAGQAQLDTFIASAQSRTDEFKSVTLTGYTDPLGDAAANDRLSLARASAVRDYLQSHGFPAGKTINVEGKGSSDPAIPTALCPSGPNQVSCLAADRRVVIQLQGS